MYNLAIAPLSDILPITEPSEQKLHQAQLLEVAVAISINGISQTVMMASPEHLKDFALGFSLSEGLINSSNHVLDIIVHSHQCGWQVDLQVLARVQHQLKQRRRTIAGPSGCALCGIDSIEAAMSLSLPQEQAAKAIKLPSEQVIMQARETLPTLLKTSGG